MGILVGTLVGILVGLEVGILVGFISTELISVELIVVGFALGE